MDMTVDSAGQVGEDLQMPAPEWPLAHFITTYGSGLVGPGAIKTWCQNQDSLGERSLPGESQIHWGPGRTLKGPREIARPRRGELWNAQAAQWHKGV